MISHKLFILFLYITFFYINFVIVILYIRLQEKPGHSESHLLDMNKMDKTELAFRLADKDQSGYIEKDEFEKMTKNLSKEQRDKAFAKCDKDGDGRINYSELSSMMAMTKKK